MSSIKCSLFSLLPTFRVSSLMWRPLIYLEVGFIQEKQYVDSFILLYATIQFYQQHLLKMEFYCVYFWLLCEQPDIHREIVTGKITWGRGFVGQDRGNIRKNNNSFLKKLYENLILQKCPKIHTYRKRIWKELLYGIVGESSSTNHRTVQNRISTTRNGLFLFELFLSKFSQTLPKHYGLFPILLVTLELDGMTRCWRHHILMP